MVDIDAGVLLDRLDRAGHAEAGVVPVQVADGERLIDLERLRDDIWPLPILQAGMLT